MGDLLLPRSGLERSDFVPWPKAAVPELSALALLLWAERKSAPALIYVCKPAEVVGNFA
jgi:hypothetical protein